MPGPATRWSDEERIEAVLTVAEEIGHPPTTSEYRKRSTDDMPSVEAIRSGWADEREPWFAALTASGLDVDLSRHRGGSPTIHDCKRGLLIAAAELAERPSPDQYRDLDILPSVPTIYDRYDTWSDAVESALDSSPIVKMLVDDGARYIPDNSNIQVRTTYGLSTHEYKGGAIQAKVAALPGHSDTEIAHALYSQADEERWQSEKRSLRHSAKLTKGIRDELRRIIKGNGNPPQVLGRERRLYENYGERLPEKERADVKAVIVDGHSGSKQASERGVIEETVYQNVRSGRERLREVAMEEGVEWAPSPNDEYPL
ncbi:homing endonuclease associated repeat-containing protein [Halostella pelagica]|uniref:homing endonuclease associated repeat-containing protein n=1 Tax=Halostella pelagica TaxID=2583824 RepID=UPI0010810CE8|nr:hypothetical protein [Halostella pelagica]